MTQIYNNLSDANATAPPDDGRIGRSDNLEEVQKLMGYVLFSLIFALGTILNFCVIYIVLRCPGMKTPCNYFLMNIAIADFAVAFVSSPLRIVGIFTDENWVVGEALCYALGPAQDVFVSVSAVTYAALTVERYRVIVTPFKPKMSLKCVVIVCGLIWLACYIAAGLPIAVFLKHVHADDVGDGNGYGCFIQFPSALYEQIFDVHLMFWFIATPVVIQTLAYYRILKSLRAASEITSVHGNETRAKKKLVRTLVLTAVIFQVCLIPRGVMMLLMVFEQVSTRDTFINYLMLLVYVLYYIKHVTNPIILFTRSTEFRNQIRGLFQSH